MPPASADVDDFVDRVLARLSNPLERAAPDTLTTDVEGALHGLHVPPPIMWPTVAGLVEHCPMVTLSPDVDTSGSAFELPVPAALPAAETQTLQKEALTGLTISLDRTTGDLSTVAAYTDLALQADAARDVVEAVLAASAALQADSDLLDALDTASTDAASLAEAVQTVAASHGPGVVIVTPIGTAELDHSGLPVIVDPLASATFVVAVLGISARFVGPSTSSAIVPAKVGYDVAVGVDTVGPEIASTAVVKITPTP